jgi:glutathione S-transferase
MMKNHNFARGARGQRVMWLCEEMGLPYAVQNYSFPVATEYRALNPLGTVAFLEDAGGVALNESVAIMLYIAQRYGPTPLLPTGHPSIPNCSEKYQLPPLPERRQSSRY